MAVDHQTVTMTFFGASMAVELLLGPTTELAVTLAVVYNAHLVTHHIAMKKRFAVVAQTKRK